MLAQQIKIISQNKSSSYSGEKKILVELYRHTGKRTGCGNGRLVPSKSS
jgi:hypothetical protein